MNELPQNTRSEPCSPSRELVDAYSDGLRDYLVEPHELALRRAWEFGRNAMASGLGLSGMSTIHHESIKKILVQTLNTGQNRHGEPTDSWPPLDSYRLLRSLAAAESTCARAAASFFAASISPFEMNQRECQLANTALRYRNSRLEGQIRQCSTLVFGEALQLLAAAGLALGRVRQKTTPSGGHLDEIQSLLERIGDQLAVCASEIQPRVLEDLGLGAAIQSISRRLSAAAHIDIVADTVVGPLLPVVSTILYRAVEESLSNVLRHAWANHVTIRLCDEGGVVQCTVSDDGIGFDAFDVFSGKADRGSGLIFIRESLRVVDGTLAVHSTPGSGTEVVMTIGRHGRTVDETFSRS